MTYKFKQIAIGGTFDLLHIGHQALISIAFKYAKLVTIGITTDKFNQMRGKTTFENQLNRRKNLTAYLFKNKFLKRSNIILLNDIYGNTISNTKIEAIVVTPETVKSAEAINFQRSKLEFKKLKIISCPQVKDSVGKIISSSRIRHGEINQNGEYYQKLLLKIAGKNLSEGVRTQLKKPFGKVIQLDSSLPPMNNLISVGDYTTQKLLSFKIRPKISIIDFKIQRKEIFTNLTQLGFNKLNPDYQVANSPGQISKTLVNQIEKSIKSTQTNQVIVVDGEEDLAVIPCILFSPLGTVVLYGQPNKGAVKVEVNQRLKDILCKLLNI